MKALVVYGTKHGSTKRIAEEMASVLKGEGFCTKTADARERVEDLADYDLVIVGSALAMRSWLRPPVRFISDNQEILKGRPVWLFSSGLLVEDPRSLAPKVVYKLERAIGPRGHRFFAGSLDLEGMSMLHRTLLRLPGVRSMFPAGDLRDWEAIREWTREVARGIASQDAIPEGRIKSQSSKKEQHQHAGVRQTMPE